MNFYYCWCPTDSCYVATFNEARKWAKTVPPLQRYDSEVRLVEVPTDKAGVLRLLNGEGTETTVRVWVVTDRGGLKEITDEA